MTAGSEPPYNLEGTRRLKSGDPVPPEPSGKSDFTTMEPHAKLLSKLMKRNINYIDDIFGSHAVDSIKKMNKGDIIMLENTAFILKNRLSAQQKTTRKHIW